jgi:hypothetical protein
MKEATDNKMVDSPVNKEKQAKAADCASCHFARGAAMCRQTTGPRALVVAKPEGCKRYKRK